MTPAIPAASSEWPMFALTLVTGIFLPGGSLPLSTSASVFISVASPNWVAVEWASRYWSSDISTPVS